MIGRNPITGDPIIIAPERAQRPNPYGQGADRCPFCPGHESDTPPEIWRDADPWHIRVFPNKYPATAKHEVIVESDSHEDTFDQFSPEHASRVVDAYVSRYRSLSREAEYVSVFKNHGEMAGASIPHLHSQVLGVPFLPSRVARESESFRQANRCPLCAAADEPAIDETEGYRWIAPRGSMMAYEQWIVPRRHAPEITASDGLATLMQKSAAAMRPIADSFNWIFMNFPRQPAAHWYLQIFPRLSMHAGFEFGSGSGINVIEPIAAAGRLRR